MTFGYQIGQQTSRNIDEGFRRSQDARAMDEILSVAASEGGAEGVQQTISQMLSQASPEAQQNILTILDKVTKEKQLNQQNQFLQKQGISSNAPEWLQRKKYDELQFDQAEQQAGKPLSKYTDDELANARNNPRLKQGVDAEIARRKEDKKPSLREKSIQKKIEKIRDKNDESGNKAKQLLMNIPELRSAFERVGWGNIGTQLAGMTAATRMAAEPFFNEAEQIIASITKDALLKSGDLTGIRLTDAKLRYMEAALPSPFKSKEANIAATDLLEKRLMLQAATLEAQDELDIEIEEEGRKLYPADYTKRLEKKLDDMGINAQWDELFKDAEGLAKEQKNENKDKKPTEDEVRYYLSLSNNDPEEAIRLAREAGYDIE